MEKKYAVAVRLPGQRMWSLHSNENGEEYKTAKERLGDCVESYGVANTAFYLVIRYEVEVTAAPKLEL